ncbi:MAG: hypothetical protein M1836_005840 [Candelina mexicana]|nr:MAG: hypothetical protein M1836_005840 [Candelina mexicana]
MPKESKRTEPPLTNAEETSKLWEIVRSTMRSSNTPAASNSSTSLWNDERRKILSNDYGVELREDYAFDCNENITALTTFNPPPGEITDRRCLITKTETELEELAEAGQFLIQTHASEASVAAWISKLLPMTTKSKMLICHHSEFLVPRAIPEGIKVNPRPIPWTKIKPDNVWFYNRFTLEDPSAWAAYNEVFVDLDNSKRPFATLALNAEHKSVDGSCKTAQLQGITAATLALNERIKIREAAGRVDIKNLSQYFFIFVPTDIQLWQLKKTSSGHFHAWRMKLPKMEISDIDGIRHFIDVWNTLIRSLLGPELESLKSDLQQIAARTRAPAIKGTKGRTPAGAAVQSTRVTRSRKGVK